MIWTIRKYLSYLQLEDCDKILLIPINYRTKSKVYVYSRLSAGY